MKLNHEFKIVWLVWIFELFIFSVKWSFLTIFESKYVFIHYPNFHDSCVSNLFIEYDFDFFEINMGYGYMNIFYSWLWRGFERGNILLYGAKIWKDHAFKFKVYTNLAT